MDIHAVAADIVAALASAQNRALSAAELAPHCSGSPEDFKAARTMLIGLKVVAEEGAGSIILRPQSGEPARRLVLVVENTAAVAHVLAALLESEGYGVLITSNLPLGLKVAKAIKVGLVVADSFANTGRAALDRLKDLRDAAHPAPVLLFTGHRDVSEKLVREAGFAGLLPKPFDIDDLLEQVSAVIEAPTAG
jgi:CheY-like chemotaxis protein